MPGLLGLGTVLLGYLDVRRDATSRARRDAAGRLWRGEQHVGACRAVTRLLSLLVRSALEGAGTERAMYRCSTLNLPCQRRAILELHDRPSIFFAEALSA